jgi:hypothetical protein
MAVSQGDTNVNNPVSLSLDRLGFKPTARDKIETAVINSMQDALADEIPEDTVLDDFDWDGTFRVGAVLPTYDIDVKQIVVQLAVPELDLSAALLKKTLKAITLQLPDSSAWNQTIQVVATDIELLDADDYEGADIDGDCRCDCGAVSMREYLEDGCAGCDELNGEE